ncbi:MAG: hypothetical protein IK104_01085 [Clostridia bacterium]|nr:hypothetical protein [Clostridia bacterium]
MTIWTTPSLEIEIPEREIPDYDQIHVTLQQGRTEIDITAFELVDAHTLRIRLTQEQSGLLNPGTVGVQVNLLSGALRDATEIANLDVGDNLLRRRLE